MQYQPAALWPPRFVNRGQTMHMSKVRRLKLVPATKTGSLDELNSTGNEPTESRVPLPFMEAFEAAETQENDRNHSK
jgi:hypothetical protein